MYLIHGHSCEKRTIHVSILFLWQRLPCEPRLLLRLRHEDTQDEGDEDADEHRDEAEEEKVGVGVEIHVENRCRAAEEAYDGSRRTDAREEDAHEEQAANGAAEQAEDGVEVVEQRLYVNRSHQPGDGHTKQTGTDTCDAGDIHGPSPRSPRGGESLVTG